jgi:hypothetical protein
MTWVPIKNVYSPPTILGHYCYVLPLIPKEIDIISKIIGKNGCHFKYLTDIPGVSYIWYNPTTYSIEIWTEYDSRLFPYIITRVLRHLHYFTIRNK